MSDHNTASHTSGESSAQGFGQTAPDPGDAEDSPTEQPLVVPGDNSAARTLGRYQVGVELDAAYRQVRDRSLDRRALGRVVPLAEADKLEQEARFLARLDHLGAPIVLDFVRNDGGAMLIMRKTDGITLAEAISQSREGRPPPELASSVAVVHLLLKISDIVAAVHAQGVVHHALTPQVIVLGSHGQVVIQDWSAAIAEKQHPATLRYVSSAPTAATMALDGLHQDIRSLGACLFSCLAFRQAVSGEMDPLGLITPEERQRLTPELEAIVRRAMASEPGDGYASITQFTQDLLRFSEGLVPAAYNPGSIAQIEAWVHRRRKPVLAITAACLVVGLTVGMVWGRQLWSWMSWREVITENFSDHSWQQRWSEPPTKQGMFTIQDGRLVSTSDSTSLLIFRQRLITPVAIEYTGEIMPGNPPGDLSVQWSEDSGVAGDPSRFGSGARQYMIQAGAFTNEFCAIYQNPGRSLLAHSNRQLEIGRKYRFRVELDGTRICMQIDGVTVMESIEEFPTRSGYLALYGFYKGKAFDDVRILQQSPGNPRSPLAVADTAFLDCRYEAAADLYAREAETPSSTSLYQQALYRKGMAEWNLGASERAGRTWSGVTDPALVMRIECIRLEGSFSPNQPTPHLTGFEEMYRNQPESRDNLRKIWLKVLQRQLDSTHRNRLVIDYFLSMREKLFPTDESARYVAATTLFAMGRFNDILAKFPEERTTCAEAMLALGQSQHVLALPSLSLDSRRHALIMRGEYAQALALPGMSGYWRTWMLIRMGRAEQALSEEVDAAYPALLHLGRADELLASPVLSPKAANEALVCLGRFHEAAGDGLPTVVGSGSSVIAMLLLGQIDTAEIVGKMPRSTIRCMQAFERGDEPAYLRLRDQLTLPSSGLNGSSGWFPALIVRPFVDWLRGDTNAFDAQLRSRLDLLSGIYNRTPWFITRAILGETPVEEVLRIPTVSEAQAWHALTSGIRAELEGHKSKAIQAYTVFTALPIHSRLLITNSPDPDVEWFVAWRLRSLQTNDDQQTK